MILEDKQNLRKQILQLHYDLSEANSLSPVMRTEVAKGVGREADAYNDEDLMSAIRYLNDKGFLKVRTNMEDSITNLGIDEVEAGYPNLPGVLFSTGDSSPLVEQMQDLLAKISNATALCEQGLLEAHPLSNLHDEVERKMAKLVENLDEIWRLKVKKITRLWRSEPKPGFCRDTEEASKVFAPWVELITEIMETLSGEKPKVTERYLGPGTPYTARKVLRGIFSSAKSELVIVDNYLHPDIIALVETYLDTNPNFKLKFLTSDMPSNNKLAGFKSDYALFKQQYPQANIEAKTNSQCHGRFLILDEKEVYHSGHSFHDLGKKGDHINRIDEEASRLKFLQDFDAWWKTGSVV